MVPDKVQPQYCAFCKRNGEQPEFYLGHKLRGENNLVTCPVLGRYQCPHCKVIGQHTLSYCPEARAAKSVGSLLYPDKKRDKNNNHKVSAGQENAWRLNQPQQPNNNRRNVAGANRRLPVGQVFQNADSENKRSSEGRVVLSGKTSPSNRNQTTPDTLNNSVKGEMATGALTSKHDWNVLLGQAANNSSACGGGGGSITNNCNNIQQQTQQPIQKQTFTGDQLARLTGAGECGSITRTQAEVYYIQQLMLLELMPEIYCKGCRTNQVNAAINNFNETLSQFSLD